jgi:hypothetical protein
MSRVLARLPRAITVLTGLGILLPWTVAAHGDAWWIARYPGYVDRLGRHCCGPSDCEPAPPGLSIRELGDGVVIDGHLLRYGEPGVYWSRDERWWVCVDLVSRKAKCVFRPQPRS